MARLTHRKITKIKQLQEISLVPVPAYQGTDITAKRGINMAETPATPDLQAQLESLKAEIESLKADKDSVDSTDSTDSINPDDDVRDDESELVEENANVKKGEKRNMQTFNKAQDTASQEVRNFEKYMKGEIEKRDLTTVNGAPMYLAPKNC